MSNTSDFVIENGVLTKYIGPGGDVVIPNGITSIGNNAFYNCSDLKSVTIPEGVTSIGNSAFAWCSSLKSVTLPDSVTSVGKTAFCKCESLMSVIISKNLTSINDWTFSRCSGLISVMIPDSVTNIGGWSFHGCSSLTSVTIPENLVEAGDSAFKSCNSLCTLIWKSHACMINQELFGDELPSGLIPQVQSIYEYMTTDAIIKYILNTNTWNSIDPNTQYEIYVNKQGKTTLPIFQKCVNEKQAEYIGNRFLEELNPKAPSRYFKTISTFMTSFSTKISPELLKRLFDELKHIKKAEKAIQAIVSDKLLMALIQDDSMCNNKKSSVEQKVYQYCRENKCSAEELLKDYYGLKLSDLPVLLDKDGKELDLSVTAFLLTACEKPGSNAWRLINDTWTTESLKSIIEDIDVRSLQTALTSLADTYLTGAGRNKKMFLAYPICRYADESTMQELTKQAAKWKTDPLSIFCNAVMYSDTKAAAFFAERVRLLNWYAAVRGTDEDTIRDTVLTETGLDENGQKTYDLGGKTVIASLRENLTIELLDVQNNKIIRTLSKQDVNPQIYEAAKRDISALRTNIKKIAKRKTDLLLGEFLSGKKTAVDSWKKIYLGNPVIRIIESLLIWEQSSTTFLPTAEGCVDCNGQKVLLTDQPICVAHPMEMKPEELTAWQKRFLSKGLKQPFEQIWEPVYDPESIKPDRYEGARIRYKYLKNRNKHGISAHIQAHEFDSDSHLTTKDCKLEFKVLFPRRSDPDMDTEFELGLFFFTHFNRQVNHNIYLLDKLTLYGRIEKDDQTIQLLLPGFTVAQITEFIRIAQKSNAINVLALLLDYKNKTFSDFNPMDEFTLE